MNPASPLHSKFDRFNFIEEDNPPTCHAVGPNPKSGGWKASFLPPTYALFIRNSCYISNRVCTTGLHNLSCRLNTGPFAHHSELNLFIKWAQVWFNIPSVLESSGYPEMIERKQMVLPPISRLDVGTAFGTPQSVTSLLPLTSWMLGLMGESLLL